MSAAATRQTPGVFAPIRSPCFIARPSPTTSGIRFASDSLLEGAVRCELVSAAGSPAPYEFLESIKKGGAATQRCPATFLL